MPAKVTEIDLEKRARSIGNTSIVKVWYQQLEDGVKSYSNKGFHSIDTAVYLQTENNRIFKIFWADEFGLHHGFGISIREIRLIDKDDGVFVEVTHDKDWQGVTGKKITSAQVHWQNIIDNMRDSLVPMLGIGHITRNDYPQTIELNFDQGQVFVSAIRITGEDKCIPFTNHVTIFFSKQAIDEHYKPLRKW